MKEAKQRAKHFLDWAQVIRVPTTLTKLKETPIDKDELDEICMVELASSQPAQCLSVRFVGEDGETLFLYFGRRVIPKNGGPPVHLIPAIYGPNLISRFSKSPLIWKTSTLAVR